MIRRAETRISKLENRVKDLEARPLAPMVSAAADAPPLMETLEQAEAAREPFPVDCRASGGRGTR